MKDLDITQVFCEVLTGLGLFLVLLSLPLLLGAYTVQEVAVGIFSKLTIAGLGAAIAVSYLLGTVMDAVGLAVDEIFLYRLIAKSEPSEEQRAKFWNSVSAHVLAYREAQWTYYSCYRNLFLLMVPGSILWTIVIWQRANVSWAAIAAMVFLLLLIALYFTMKALVRIYFQITKSL